MKNSKKIDSSLNRGVPTDTSVILSTAQLANIAKNDKQFLNIIEKEFKNLIEYISSLARRREDIDFFKTVETVTDPETLKRKIIFSPTQTIISLVVTLSDKRLENESILNPDEQIDNLFERLKLLGKIKNIQQLEMNFPLLAKKYKDEIQLYNELKELNKQYEQLTRMEKRMIQKNKQYVQIKKELDRLSENGGHRSVEKFCTDYGFALINILSNISKIIDYEEKHPIAVDKNDLFDKEKLDLYIASQYIKQLKIAPSVELKQKYLYYLSTYFFEYADRIEDNSLAIELSFDKIKEGLAENLSYQNQKITIKDLYNIYTDELKKYPNLRVINFEKDKFKKMTLSEVDNYMEDYLLDLQVNWEFFAKKKRTKNDNDDSDVFDGEDDDFIDDIFKKIHDPNLSLEEKKLLKLFMEKKKIFDSSEPIYRIRGKNTFDGYFGYIYQDGTVIFERFFTDSTKKTLAKNQAIYIMPLEKFIEVSQKSKNKIIRDRLCDRLIHQGNWQEKLQNKISETSANSMSDTEIMILDKLVRLKGK